MVDCLQAVYSLCHMTEQLTLQDITPAKIGTFGQEVLFEMRDLIAKELRTVEGVYKELRRPFQAELDRLRKEHKPDIDDLTDLKREVNQKLLELEREAKKEQTAKDLETMKRLTEPEKYYPIEETDQKMISVKQKVRVRKTLRWNILDIKIVPREFLIPNDQKLRAAGKWGERIEGIRFYYDEVPY